MKNCNKKYDSIITDIPYGIGFHGDKDPDNNWDDFTNSEYTNFLNIFFNETFKITKDNSIMFVFAAPTKIYEILTCKNPWKFHPEYYYHYCRAKGRGSKNKLKSLREDILCFSKGNIDLHFDEIEELKKYRKENNKPIGYALDICTGKRIPQYSLLNNSFYITPPSYNNVAEKQIHSCQKPILLMAELIMASSSKGEEILDPFMGSGVTGIASYLCDRNFTGIELDKDMYDKAVRWSKDAQSNTRIHQYLMDYLKKHVSSSEKEFRFGWDSRLISSKN